MGGIAVSSLWLLNDVSTNHNRSYEIARGPGEELGLIVVKGSEITRKMPPGHLNAIFLTNSALLAVDSRVVPVPGRIMGSGGGRSAQNPITRCRDPEHVVGLVRGVPSCGVW